jgi:hypothetical protein
VAGSYEHGNGPVISESKNVPINPSKAGDVFRLKKHSTNSKATSYYDKHISDSSINQWRIIHVISLFLGHSIYVKSPDFPVDLVVVVHISTEWGVRM